MTDHPMYFIVGYFLFSSLVGGMPVPDPSSSKGYLWLFQSLHILAGNLTTAIQAKYPDVNK